MQLDQCDQLLKDALEIIEGSITIPIQTAEGKLTIKSEDARIFGFDHTLPELTDDKLRELALDIAKHVNEAGMPYSIPLHLPKGTAFEKVAVGKKVYLRLVAYYDIEWDRFIVKLDCMVAQPVAVEVAA